jgi:hypothetical protein
MTSTDDADPPARHPDVLALEELLDQLMVEQLANVMHDMPDAPEQDQHATAYDRFALALDTGQAHAEYLLDAFRARDLMQIGERLDALRWLDGRSVIVHLIFLASVGGISQMQSNTAALRNMKARAVVRREWQAERARNPAATKIGFAEQIQPDVWKRFEVKVEPETIARYWLKGAEA